MTAPCSDAALPSRSCWSTAPHRIAGPQREVKDKRNLKSRDVTWRGRSPAPGDWLFSLSATWFRYECCCWSCSVCVCVYVLRTGKNELPRTRPLTDSFRQMKEFVFMQIIIDFCLKNSVEINKNMTQPCELNCQPERTINVSFCCGWNLLIFVKKIIK